MSSSSSHKGDFLPFFLEMNFEIQIFWLNHCICDYAFNYTLIKSDFAFIINIQDLQYNTTILTTLY